MTKKQKILGPKVHVGPTPAQVFTAVQAKFKRLKDIRDKLIGLKALYQEHDTIMSELLPLFITVESDKFTVRRSVTVGDKTYRFSPYFYDEKKGKLNTKVWKACAHESGSVE